MICRSCGFFHESRDELEPVCAACETPFQDRSREYVVPEFGFIAGRIVREPGMRPPEHGSTYDDLDAATAAVVAGVGAADFWSVDDAGTRRPLREVSAR